MSREPSPPVVAGFLTCRMKVATATPVPTTAAMADAVAVTLVRLNPLNPLALFDPFHTRLLCYRRLLYHYLWLPRGEMQLPLTSLVATLSLQSREALFMKADRAILAAGATVQFSTLALVNNPHTRIIGFVTGMLTGTILLLLAIGIRPLLPPVASKRRAEIRKHD